MKPIEYGNENDGVFVTVQPHQDYGMATIWDADILIWAASVLCDMKNRGTNDIPRELKFQPNDLPRAISRSTGGRDYAQLRDALERLKTTAVTTNIRVLRGKKNAMFSWIDGWEDPIDAQTKESRGMSLFASENPEKPMWRDNVWYRNMKPKLDLIGLDWASFQELRRTHASLGLGHEIGVDPKVAADQRGHGIGVALDVYTKAATGKRAEPAEKLEKAVFAA